MVFIKNLTKITEEKYKIGYVHYMPLDLEYGLNKTVQQLEEEGVLIDKLPIKDNKENKQAVLYYNPKEKNIFYEYEEISKVIKNKDDIKVSVDELKENNKLLTETVAKLTIDSKKKDVMATKLATTVAKMNIEMNKLKEGNK